MVDSIADMLTRIRNGQRACLFDVKSPYSKFRESVLKVMVDEGYIASYQVAEVRDKIKEINIKLKYTKEGKPAISEIKKISKPGRRYYASVSDLKPVYNNMGIAIISTPAGVITDHEARKKCVGGEVICEIF